MLKGYIKDRKLNEDPNINEATYWFWDNAKGAMFWETRFEAENAAALFNGLGVNIPSSEGGIYTIYNFQVEEESPDHFVIWAEAPFIKQGSGRGPR